MEFDKVIKVRRKTAHIFVIILAVVALIVYLLIFSSDELSLPIDLRGGELCGRTAGGFGTCGYTGPVKDCDCDGEKYTFWNGVTDVGLEIKCDGKASNFREVPLPNDICEHDPERRCQLLGGSACDKLILDTNEFSTLGKNSSNITILEFGSFQCPYCKKFYDDFFLSIKNDYVHTGKVKFVWINFPLENQPESFNSALAAKCAEEQDKFWEMHDLLFENQEDLSLENYKRWASQIGLNETEFNQCLETKKYLQKIQHEIDVSEEFKISGTPTFFINTKRVVGAESYETIKLAIESELKKFQ